VLAAAGLDPRTIRTAVDTGAGELLEDGLGTLAATIARVERSAA
jgi:hypothetical protein